MNARCSFFYMRVKPLKETNLGVAPESFISQD